MSKYLDNIKFKIEALNSFDYLNSLKPGEFVRVYTFKEGKEENKEWYDVKLYGCDGGKYTFCDILANPLELDSVNYGKTWLIDKNPIVGPTRRHSKYINLCEFIKMPKDGIKTRKHYY